MTYRKRSLDIDTIDQVTLDSSFGFVTVSTFPVYLVVTSQTRSFVSPQYFIYLNVPLSYDSPVGPTEERSPYGLDSK